MILQIFDKWPENNSQNASKNKEDRKEDNETAV
jgi:hypothetical protein